MVKVVQQNGGIKSFHICEPKRPKSYFVVLVELTDAECNWTRFDEDTYSKESLLGLPHASCA